MARKKNDTAGVFEKYPGSGIWYIRVRTEDGYIRKRIGTREAAETALATINLAKITKQPIVNLRARGETVGKLCDIYLDHVQNPDNPEAPSDIYGIKIRIRAIREAFGDRVASTVQASEIRRWLVDMGKKASTLNRYRSVLSSVYRHAKEEGYVSANPVRDLKQFRVELPHPRWMRQEEEKRIRSVLQKWVDECPPQHRLTRLYLECHPHELTLAMNTGLRKRNLYSLRWDEHIDMETKYFRLPPEMMKNRRALDMPMIGKTHDALMDLKRIRDAVALIKKDDENDSRMVDDGRVLLMRENREWWEQARSEAKVKNLRWHDLRHTFATRLVERGVHLSVVQKLCGHSSHNTTTRYAHVDDKLIREAMNKLA
jgi:site-specific recombinase XerD